MASVVVIDDEAQVRLAFKAFLKGLGHRVHVFDRAEAGIAHCYTNETDAVFLDIVMPNVEGLATLRALKTLKPTLRVACMTGYRGREAEVDYLELAEAQGADAVFHKPVPPEAIAGFVDGL